MRATEMLAGLSPAEPPRLAFLRRASVGVAAPPETLLCLSASFNPMTVAHAALIREGSRLVPAQETLLLLATVNVDKSGEGLPLDRVRLGWQSFGMEVQRGDLVEQDGHGVEIAGKGVRAHTQRFERNRAAAGKRVHDKRASASRSAQRFVRGLR